MKKMILLLGALCLLLCASCALAEDDHEHDWRVERTSGYHWAKCRICGEESEKEPHYTLCIDKEANQCIACEMTKAQGAVIETFVHYVPDDAVAYNELIHWHFCALCGEIMDMGLHESTCLNPEVCSVCGATAEEGAQVPFTPHAWEMTWDQNGHYETCSSCGSTRNYEDHYVYCDTEDKTVCLGCGQKHSDQLFVWQTRHKGERMAYNNEYHYSVCDLCGVQWGEETHFSTCADPDACDTCGARAADGAIYTVWHDWEVGMRYDNAGHWTECQVCGEKTGQGPHEARCNNPERCMSCDATTADGAEMQVVHLPHTQYGYSDDYHWLTCIYCDTILDEGPHQFDGSACAVCGYVERTQYRFRDLSYDGHLLTGVLARGAESSEAENLNIRVTFYIAGNYYMATGAQIEEDGSFEVEGVGPIVYITVLASGTERRIDGSTITRTFDAQEVFVN